MSKRRNGKYYHIKSVWNDLVLEVKDALDRPCAPVVTAKPLGDLQGSNDHQLWWTDRSTSTIRSKLNSYCLDLKDDMLVIHPHVRGNTCQRWGLVANKLQLQDDFETVLGIHGDIRDPGAPLVGEPDDDKESQRWKIDHRPAQFFYIRSQMDEEKVLDIKQSNKKPGANLLLYKENNDLRDNQMWYEDEQGIIRTKLNGYAIDTSVEKFATMMPLDKDVPKQHWLINGNTMCNMFEPKEVLTIRQSRSPTNPLKTIESVTSDQYRGSIDQHWFFEYIPDQSLSLSHAGNGKEFFIRNKLTGLVLELKDGQKKAKTDVVTSYRQPDTDNETRQQLFYVDEPTGTIKSAANDMCLDIPDSILAVARYDPYSKDQQWRIVGDKIKNRNRMEQVLEVYEGSMEPGASVVPGDDTDDPRQQWEMQHVPARLFMLSNQGGRILDIAHGEASSGGYLILYERNTPISVNQKWYEDEKGCLRSKLNGYMPDGKGKTAVMSPLDPANQKQQWILIGDRIQNKYDKDLVIEIDGKSRKNKTKIKSGKDHGGEGQRWQKIYL